MSSGSRSIGAVLTSDSIQDAADRLQYTQSIVQGDADLATQVAVTTEEMRRQEARLRQAARQEARAVAELEDERAHRRPRPASERRGRGAGDQAGGRGGRRHRRQPQRRRPPISITGTGAIQTCPVAGRPRSLIPARDPRPGGRSHEGSTRSPPTGRRSSPSTEDASTAGSIGGLGVVVQHGNGDWTFYAHSRATARWEACPPARRSATWGPATASTTSTSSTTRSAAPP